MPPEPTLARSPCQRFFGPGVHELDTRTSTASRAAGMGAATADAPPPRDPQWIATSRQDRTGQRLNMSLRISIASIAIATLLGGCGRGQAFDPFMEELKDASTNSCTQTPTSMCGTQPMVKTTAITFPSPLNVNGSACQALVPVTSPGIVTLDGTGLAFGSSMSKGFQFDCSVQSNAIDIPANANRVVLRFKVSHRFSSELGTNGMAPRITRGALLLREKNTSTPLESQPGFLTRQSQAYEVRMELPQSLAGKSIIIEPQISGFAYNWAAADRFNDLQLTLTDPAFETTQ